MVRLLALFLLSLLCWPASATKVTVGVNHSPPYRILEEDSVGGFYVDVFNALAEELDWSVEYRVAPFRRVLWMLETGDADIMLGALPTPEREAYMDFTVQAFPPEPKHFFHVAPENLITEYADLQGKVIGVLRGSTYAPDFDEDATLILEPATSYKNLMRMLEAERIDLVVAPELVGRHTAARASERISVSPFTLRGTRSYIAVSRQSDIMTRREELQQAMQSLRKNGTIERIHHRYIVEE